MKEQLHAITNGIEYSSVSKATTNKDKLFLILSKLNGVCAEIQGTKRSISKIE